MVGKVIRDYMERGGKKLTVPGFGTFMRKDAGGVIFVDLLRKDDGVLRELVEDEGHYSEVEAMVLVDRFTFETKNDIGRQGSSVIEGFGTMTLDYKGLYQFNYSPKAELVKEEHAVQERLFGESVPEIVREAPKEAHSEPDGSHRASPEADLQPDMPGPNERKGGRGGFVRSDMFILIAIAAAVIAIVAMVFAFSTGNIPFIKK